MWGHSSTDHNLLYGRVVGKVMVLGVTPEFFLWLLNNSMIFIACMHSYSQSMWVSQCYVIYVMWDTHIEKKEYISVQNLLTINRKNANIKYMRQLWPRFLFIQFNRQNLSQLDYKAILHVDFIVTKAKKSCNWL